MNRTRSPLETLVRQAFHAAWESRTKAGLGAPASKIWRRRDGTRGIGPKTYRVTLYLQPWQYASLIDQKRRAGFAGSLNAFMMAAMVGHAPSRRLLGAVPSRARKAG